MTNGIQTIAIHKINEQPGECREPFILHIQYTMYNTNKNEEIGKKERMK